MVITSTSHFFIFVVMQHWFGFVFLNSTKVGALSVSIGPWIQEFSTLDYELQPTGMNVRVLKESKFT